MTELEDKNIKIVIITVFDMFKKVKLQHVNQKQGKHKKKNQTEYLEKKNTMSDWMRVTAEYRLHKNNKFEYITIESI